MLTWQRCRGDAANGGCRASNLNPRMADMGRDGMDTAQHPVMKGPATKKRAHQNRTASNCAKVEIRYNHLRNGEPKMNVTTYGLDVAKRVFQMYWALCRDNGGFDQIEHWRGLPGC